MNRLWIANIMRMVKNKLFWLAVVFMSLVGIGFPIMNYMVMIKNDFPLFIDNSFFMGTMFIGILLSIFCSLFIGTEYNDLSLIHILERHQQDFFVYPAAMRNHHDFVGGLATHVLGMLQMGESVCRQYENLHRDLLLAGILLHDVGKLVELSGAIVTEYTMQGKLLGHISIMQAEIDQIATEIGVAESEEAILLRHMVLSHHGVYEYGSPVLPMIPEAEVL